MPGVAWNAGMFAWQRGAIRTALEKYTPLPMLIDQAVGSDLALANAYDRITPISIDRAVMESAAADHHVVMGAMDVGWSDLGSWTALLARDRRRPADGATGRVVQPGETIDVGPDDLVVRPAGGRLVVEAGPALAAAGGTIVADGVWAHLAGARHLDRRGRATCSTGSTTRRSARDDHRRGADARRRSSSGPTAGARRSPTTSRSRTSAAAPTASPATSSGAATQAKGVVVAFDRRFASEHFAAAAAEVLLAHDIPVFLATHAVPTQMSSYEVVQRGAAAGIVITASHNPWTDNGFKVKAPTGAAAGGDILRRPRGRDRARTAATAIERRPLADAEAAGLVERFDPFEGYERFVRRTIDLDALKAADLSVLVEPLYGVGSGWIPRLLARRPDPGHRDPQRAQPVLRRDQPRADPAERRRGAGPDRRRRLRPGAAARRRRGPRRARPTSRARSSTSSRSPGC